MADLFNELSIKLTVLGSFIHCTNEWLLGGRQETITTCFLAEQTKSSGMVQSHLVASCQMDGLAILFFVPLFIPNSNMYMCV